MIFEPGGKVRVLRSNKVGIVFAVDLPNGLVGVWMGGSNSAWYQQGELELLKKHEVPTVTPSPTQPPKPIAPPRLVAQASMPTAYRATTAAEPTRLDLTTQTTGILPADSYRVATQTDAGCVRPDGITILVQADGTISTAPFDLPSQAGHAGSFLATDGTTARWQTVDGGTY